MSSYSNTPGNPSINKDTKLKGQTRTVLASFSECPKTMLEVSLETGILRANICRYVAQSQKEGRLHLAYKGICPITRHPAGFYTTDFSLIRWEEAESKSVRKFTVGQFVYGVRKFAALDMNDLWFHFKSFTTNQKGVSRCV